MQTNGLRVALTILLVVICLFVSGCTVDEGAFPTQSSELTSLNFENQDLRECYIDSYRDLGNKPIFNRNYAQMAHNFEYVVDLKYPDYFSQKSKSQRNFIEGLDVDSQRKLFIALSGISCNFAARGEEEKAFQAVEPIAELFDKKKILYRNFPETGIALGFLDGKRGLYSSSINRFTAMIDGEDFQTEYAEAHYGRALTYINWAENSGDESEAISRALEDLNILISSPRFSEFPFRVETYWALGKAKLNRLLRMNESEREIVLQEAIEAFKNAIAQDTPSSHLADVYDKLGVAYTMQSNYELAIDSFNAALEKPVYKCEDSSSIYLHFGQALMKANRYREGAKQCSVAKKLKAPNLSTEAENDCISDYYAHLGNILDENLDSDSDALKKEKCGADTA